MKNRWWILLISFFVACNGGSGDNEAVVAGEVEGVDAGELISIAPEGDMNKMISAPVEDGRFKIRVPIQPGEADWYQLWIGSVPSPSKMTSVYLDAGETHISIPVAGFARATFSGALHAKEFNEVTQGLAKADSLYKIRTAAKGEGRNEAAVFLEKWINSHPSSALGTALLDKYKSRPLAMDTCVAYFQQRGKAALNNRPARRLEEWVKRTANVLPGQTAPEFSQPDTAGNSVALKDFRGKYVLLDFWASWCAPCRAENPTIVKAYQNYKDKGFTVLGVSLDRNDKTAWLKAIHKDSLPWTQVSDLKYFENAAAVLYHVDAIPANFLIDPNGVIIARSLRGVELDKRLAEIFGDVRDE